MSERENALNLGVERKKKSTSVCPILPKVKGVMDTGHVPVKVSQSIAQP